MFLKEQKFLFACADLTVQFNHYRNYFNETTFDTTNTNGEKMFHFLCTNIMSATMFQQLVPKK